MKPLVISYSALATFARCRRAYYYGYELGLEPRTKPGYMEEGSEFHACVEAEAKHEAWPINCSDMAIVAETFLLAHPLPKAEDIIAVEEPVYVDLIKDHWPFPDDVGRKPDVILRCTPDLIYRRGEWIIVRDYKTFGKKPTLDRDFDVQAKTYAAIMRQKYGDKVMFEFVHVRRTPPGVPHNKKGDCWEPDECYLFQEIYAPDHELDELWKELQDLAGDLLRCRAEGRWYRQPAACCGSTMGTPLYKGLCCADLKEGGLSEQDIALLATKKSI
jgi:hypothetical protein